MTKNIIHLLSCLLLCIATVTNSFAQLLPDFIDETLNTSLEKPVGITFDETGKAYIWEQSGLVHIMDTTGTISNTPMIDIREEVSVFVDHGFLGFALDPKFSQNGYVYLLYVVDPHHLYNYGTPDYNPNTTIINAATIGRITRYTADPDNNFETVIENSRKILLGDNISNGFPVVASSHGVGTLTFGTDGTLLVSCGETGSFVSSDAGNHSDSFYEEALAQGIIRPAENVGAYRSQMLNSLNGKILRIDPETGNGIPSNPFYDAEAPDAKSSKIWARGLRNPFRMYLDLETGSHFSDEGNPGVIYIGDVGASLWEELNIATTGGQNFGWPIYEGMAPKSAFANMVRDNLDAPNPLFETNNCEQEFYTFHDLITQPNSLITPVFPNPCNAQNQVSESLFPSIHTRPTIAWLNHHQMTDSVAVIPAFDTNGNAIDIEIERAESGVEGIHFNGSSSLAGFHYHGDNFPEEYQERYFHADFNGWISIFDFDENYKLIKVDTFATAVKGIVDLKVSPYDGCIYYVKVIEGPSVHRICYGGDPPPVAIAKADINFGSSPLTVNLDASDSYHPKDYPFTLEWKLPNGETSDALSLSYVFESGNTQATAINVELLVTDSVGNTDTDELIISLNNTPPQVEITSVQDGDLYPITDFTYLPLRANVSDTEHTDEELIYQWKAFLYHNSHNHAGPTENNREAFALLEPLGCNDETYWYRVELTVTDPAGLSTKDIVEVYPNCGVPFGEDIMLSGEPKPEKNILSWQNPNEQDIREYEIQRSVNNTDFITIGWVENRNALDYTFDDTNPLWGTNKYRIKALRNDNIYDYSNRISLEFPGEQDFSVFPNPTDNILNIVVKESTGKIDFDLFDASGKLILSKSWQDDTMDGIKVAIATSPFPNGVYYYQINNGTTTFHGSVLRMN
ncbi:MAG: glucose/arabinose dehydrogenase [Saprospiraceae bacterium]|jgi:glucose/arabinose dehydrogenase